MCLVHEKKGCKWCWEHSLWKTIIDHVWNFRYCTWHTHTNCRWVKRAKSLKIDCAIVHATMRAKIQVECFRAFKRYFVILRASMCPAARTSARDPRSVKSQRMTTPSIRWRGDITLSYSLSCRDYGWASINRYVYSCEAETGHALKFTKAYHVQ